MGSRPPASKSKFYARRWREERSEEQRVAEKRLTTGQKLVLFAVVPSLFCWATVWLVVIGDFRAAMLLVSAAAAGAIIGWYSHAVTHDELK